MDKEVLGSWAKPTKGMVLRAMDVPSTRPCTHVLSYSALATLFSGRKHYHTCLGGHGGRHSSHRPELGLGLGMFVKSLASQDSCGFEQVIRFLALHLHKPLEAITPPRDGIGCLWDRRFMGDG